MEKLNTVLKLVSNNGNVKFPVTENAEFLETSIDDLDLDMRSSNSLHRSEMRTIKDVLSKANELHRIRNCGTKSINRIMYKICCYYYSKLNENEKITYLRRIVELNTTSEFKN